MLAVIRLQSAGSVVLPRRMCHLEGLNAVHEFAHAWLILEQASRLRHVQALIEHIHEAFLPTHSFGSW